MLQAVPKESIFITQGLAPAQMEPHLGAIFSINGFPIFIPPTARLLWILLPFRRQHHRMAEGAKHQKPENEENPPQTATPGLSNYRISDLNIITTSLFWQNRACLGWLG